MAVNFDFYHSISAALYFGDYSACLGLNGRWIFDCKALPGNRIIADGQDTIINFIYIILGYVLGSTGSQNASAAETGLCF